MTENVIDWLVEQGIQIKGEERKKTGTRDKGKGNGHGQGQGDGKRTRATDEGTWFNDARSTTTTQDGCRCTGNRREKLYAENALKLGKELLSLTLLETDVILDFQLLKPSRI